MNDLSQLLSPNQPSMTIALIVFAIVAVECFLWTRRSQQLEKSYQDLIDTTLKNSFPPILRGSDGVVWEEVSREDWNNRHAVSEGHFHNEKFNSHDTTHRDPDWGNRALCWIGGAALISGQWLVLGLLIVLIPIHFEKRCLMAKRRYAAIRALYLKPEMKDYMEHVKTLAPATPVEVVA